MKAIAKDIKHSVFDDETEAILYMIKDIYEAETCYIFSLPVYTFSISVKENEDIEEALKWERHFLSDPDRKKRFIAEMCDMMNEL